MLARTAAPLVLADELGYHYRRAREWALDGVSLKVEPGCVVGLVGPNGSGKTTFFRLVLGFARPGAGQLLIGETKPGNYRKARGIGYLPERVRLPGTLRVGEFAALMAGLAGLRGSAVRSSVGRLVDTLAIEEAVDERIEALSHGYRQRVGLLAALIGDPQLLLLDEPANGLDPSSLGVLRSLIRALRRAGNTVIVSSHNLLELQRVCDVLVILQQGRILKRITSEQLNGHKTIWVVRLGGDRIAGTACSDRAPAGVRLASDELAFTTERAARAWARRAREAGVRVEAVEARPFDLEFLFHSLTQRRAAARTST